MKIYGHPWSINTRKTLLTLAEKGGIAELVLVMIPKGEQNKPEHLALHPFGKVPVLNDDGFVLYETRAINRYLDAKLAGVPLLPSDARAQARVDQWIGIAESYFAPHAHALIVELLFRRYLGGEQSAQAIEAARRGIEPALDALEARLVENDYIAGAAFSLADIQWIPYLEYLTRIGEGAPIDARKNVAAWWARVQSRPAWQRVARSGPQPYEQGMTTEAVERELRGPGGARAQLGG